MKNVKKSYHREPKRDGGIGYKHDLGQHFLYDEDLLRSLVAATGVTKQDKVLEIGPGAGTLTKCLCEAAGEVLAVEVDHDVLPFLKLHTQGMDNLTIVEGDIRKVDLQELCKPLGKDFFVIANIPYNITTQIFECLWESGLPIGQISVMIQKEVAYKLMAKEGTSDYSAISVKAQLLSDISLVKIVPAQAFVPPPKVDSAFIRMDMKQEPFGEGVDESHLMKLIKAGFALRRKTLLNALKGVVNGIDVKDALEATGLSEKARAEELSPAQWIELAKRV